VTFHRFLIGPTIAALAVILASPGLALAWDSQAHRIAATIAEQYLEPDAASTVRELLASENAAGLVAVAREEEERGERAHWHFVEIPVHPLKGTPFGYDAQRDCPEGDCAVAAVERWRVVLADRSAAPRERLAALKLLVQVVVDLHEPLHCAADEDHGADIHIYFLDQHTTLYAAWERDFLAAATIRDDGAYALQLVRSITARDLVRWRQGTPADWTTESYGIARLIHGGSHESRALQAFYETDFLPVIDTQLKKAGVRLAAVLNAALK